MGRKAKGKEIVTALEAYKILRALHDRRKMDAVSQQALEYAMAKIAADIVDTMLDRDD